MSGKLSDPTFEPSDGELQELARQAFANVRSKLPTWVEDAIEGVPAHEAREDARS